MNKPEVTILNGGTVLDRDPSWEPDRGARGGRAGMVVIDDLEELIERLWDKIEVSPSGCWLWTGSTTRGGYGSISVSGRLMRAHRLTYLLCGPEELSPDLELDHRCVNPSCVNPAHLRQVSHKQNQEHLTGAKSHSTTGARGVYRRGKGYQVRVRHQGRQYHGGQHPSIDQADRAARDLRASLFTHDDYQAA